MSEEAMAAEAVVNDNPVESQENVEVSEHSEESNESGEVVNESVQEEAEGLAEELENADSAEEKAEVIEKIRKLKLKVDGQEIEEELPFDVTPEMAEYLKKELQMSKMAQKRAQEAAELKKNDAAREAELANFLQELKSNPELILGKLDVDTKALAEKILEQEVELMEMSPEERKIKELTDELARRDAEKQKIEQERAEREKQDLRDKYAADYENQILSAIDNTGLPNNPAVIEKMGRMMSIALEEGIDLSFNDIAPIIKEERDNDVRQKISSMSADEVLALLADNVVQDIVVKKMPTKKKEAPKTAQTIVDSGQKTEKDDGPKYRNRSANDFFRKLRMGELD